MLTKLAIIVGALLLWLLRPALRVPKENFFRRKLGLWGTYLLIIVGMLAILQIADLFLNK